MVMDIKRIDDLKIIEKIALKHMWPTIKKTEKDGKWRKFVGDLIVQNQRFDVSCEFRFMHDLFSYRNFDIKKDGKLVNREEELKASKTITIELNSPC